MIFGLIKPKSFKEKSLWQEINEGGYVACAPEPLLFSISTFLTQDGYE